MKHGVWNILAALAKYALRSSCEMHIIRSFGKNEQEEAQVVLSLHFDEIYLLGSSLLFGTVPFYDDPNRMHGHANIYLNCTFSLLSLLFTFSGAIRVDYSTLKILRDC